MGFGDRGVVGDKWSSKFLWLAALGSFVGLYMLALDRQTHNRQKSMAASLRAESGGNAAE